MWMFTQYGFYSIVVDTTCRPKLMVRSRDRRHLVNLKKRFPLIRNAAIASCSKKDYPFRIHVTPRQWSKIAAKLAYEVNYPNFKDQSSKRRKNLGDAYVESLHEVWQALRDATAPEPEHYDYYHPEDFMGDLT